MRTGFQISSLVPSGLVFDGVSDSMDSVILAVRSEAAEAQCPLCATASRRIHSRYIRHVADLPSAGRRVRLRLLTRRFTCEVLHCRRRIFAERFGEDIVPLRRRRTARLEYIVHTWGWRSAAGRRQASPSGSCCPSATIPCCGWSAGGRRCRWIPCLLWASMTGRSGEIIDTGRSCAIWSAGGSLPCCPTGKLRPFGRGYRSTQRSTLCREIAVVDTARQQPRRCRTPSKSPTAGI